MRTARKQCESNVYHVVTRGVGQQIIFEDDADRERFLALLGESFADRGELLAWCLMDNHVHLLVRLELHELSGILRKLFASYALFFNRRHGRCGHLFQDRFSSEPVETDEYLLTAVRYIHQNPQKAGMSSAQSYRWSSYGNYLGKRGMCSTALVLELLGGVDAFKKFHAKEEKAKCMDIAVSRKRMGDEEALSLAKQALGENPADRIAQLSKGERNDVLRFLKDAGLTCRQIQRITGIGRGIIEKL